jgi:gamma-glutamyl phosphate reductase
MPNGDIGKALQKLKKEDEEVKESSTAKIGFKTDIFANLMNQYKSEKSPFLALAKDTVVLRNKSTDQLNENCERNDDSISEATNLDLNKEKQKKEEDALKQKILVSKSIKKEKIEKIAELGEVVDENDSEIYE